MSKVKCISKCRIKGYFDRTLNPGVAHSQEYCDDFEDCPSVLTPSEALLRLQAGGQIADLKARRLYYDDEEYKQYVEDPEFVDYFQKYRDLQAQKIQAWKDRNYNINKEVNNGLQENEKGSQNEQGKEGVSSRSQDSQTQSTQTLQN